MFHFAPEKSLRPAFEKHFGGRYLSCDLEMPGVHLHFDITAIPFTENVFDYILCRHVLEHTLDDTKAMAELNRILRPDGVLIVMVPIEGEVTFEDPSVTDPAERKRLFRQDDHVRIFGTDIVKRLKGVGFEVAALRPHNICRDRVVGQMALDPDEYLFACRKP